MAKGQKTGGRKKGTPNKVTKQTREWLGVMLKRNRRIFEKRLKNCEDAEYCRIFAQLLPYVVPKKTEAEINGQMDLHTLTDEQLQQVINDITINLND